MRNRPRPRQQGISYQLGFFVFEKARTIAQTMRKRFRPRTRHLPSPSVRIFRPKGNALTKNRLFRNPRWTRGLSRGILLAGGLVLVPAVGTMAVPTTAMGIVDDLGPGWNLGNTMDGTGGETGWGNPKTTQQMIDVVHQGGMRSMRLPVRWDEHVSGSDFTIASSWLDRVEEIANYALKDSMYVIINVHHNDGWEDPIPSNETSATNHLVKLWAQIANRFKKYDNHVIFETMNEPRKQNPDDWSGNTDDYAVVNRMNAAALAAIRATGGNNASRLVTMPGYAANNDSRMKYTTVPKDPMVAVAVHSYDPQAICFGTGGQTAMTSSDKTFIDNMFAQVSSTFVQKGIPVVMGEWAPTNKNNTSARADLALYFCNAARKVRVPVILWDNGSVVVGSDGMGFLNRKTVQWEFPTIIQAMVKAQPPTDVAPSLRTSTSLEMEYASGSCLIRSPFEATRFLVTGIDGRTRSFAGGKTLVLRSDAMPRGVYVVRAEHAGGFATAKFVNR